MEPPNLFNNIVNETADEKSWPYLPTSGLLLMVSTALQRHLNNQGI